MKIETKQTTNLQRWIVVISASLLFFYTYIQISMLNSISPALMKTFSIDAVGLGYLSSTYFWGNFVLVFPAGIMLDHFSTRKLLLGAMALAVISMFAFAFSTNAVFAGFTRLLGGIAGGFCFVCPLRLASRWFSSKHLALAVGVIVILSMLGNMVAQTPTVILASTIGWRMTTIVFGIVGIVFLGLMWVFVKDCPAEYDFAQERAARDQSVWRGILVVISNWKNWLAGLVASTLNLPTFLLGALWGVLYLTTAGASKMDASYVAIALFLGALIGSPTIGWLSDKLSRRKFLLLVAALLLFALSLLVFFVQLMTLWQLLLLFFCFGFLSSAWPLCCSLAIELNPMSVTGAATGIVSLMIMLGALVVQPLFGYLMDIEWKHVLFHNIPIYGLDDFHHALLILPIAFALCFLCALLLPETLKRSR